MAEAQPAVAFQFIVTPEGWNLKVDNHALTAVFMSGLRSWQKSLTWLQRRFITGDYLKERLCFYFSDERCFKKMVTSYQHSRS